MKKTEHSTQKGFKGGKVSTHTFGGSNPKANGGITEGTKGKRGSAAGDR